MNLQELIKKYPFVEKYVEVHEGVQYLNVKKLEKNVNRDLERDLLGFTGEVLIDNSDLKLDEGEELLLG